MTPPSVPPRVSHLMTLGVLAEQLAPSYAVAVNRLPGEVLDEIRSGLREANLHLPVLEAMWKAMGQLRPRLDQTALLEKLASAMTRTASGPRPMAAEERVRNGMNTLFAFVDVNVGRASETARAVLESQEGQRMLQKSVDVTGRFLADRVLASAKKSKHDLD